MRKRLKLKSYPLARCGTMCSETKREHTLANSRGATCVVISNDLHHLHGAEFAAAVREAIISHGWTRQEGEGFIFGGATA
tara:strand:- start:348 stop:587 length:240 start_codon:yes stop_codon:yes gene_type:complete